MNYQKLTIYNKTYQWNRKYDNDFMRESGKIGQKKETKSYKKKTKRRNNHNECENLNHTNTLPLPPAKMTEITNEMSRYNV